MAQAKKKTATRTAKKQTRSKSSQRSRQSSRKQTQQQNTKSNTFFLISMTFLAASLLFANLLFFTSK